MSSEPLKLQGFNNLTKTLSFNSYNVAYTPTAPQRAAWLAHIAERYSCERLTKILSEVATLIDASILNIASQTYDPQGASVTLLVAEKSIDAAPHAITTINTPASPEHVVMHLDKSHLTVHTYPESDVESGMSVVRVDIDVSTCGWISPLRSFNYLIRSLESDIVTTDYRMRGFIRGHDNKKHFIDHKIKSIQDFIATDILRRYSVRDVNLRSESIFHTRMVRKAFAVEDYLFGYSVLAQSNANLQQIKQVVSEEMMELFEASSGAD